MKNHNTTIFANLILALMKGVSAVLIIGTKDFATAAIPLLAAVLLIISSVLIGKQIKWGALLATAVASFFLMQFFTTGSNSKLLPYLILHAAVVALNLSTWKALDSGKII